jgi:pimeloyl-ACP methyl ester carboxylesterase
LLVCIHGGGCNARYFDLKGFSVVERALARGMPVLLVNRPGHGGSAPPRTERAIDEAAALIPPLIQEVRGDRPVVIIGHSIGGAVALALAAKPTAWPLKAIAVSGIGDRITAEFEQAWSTLLSGVPVETDINHFFGPEGTYRWTAPMALRQASEPWQGDEVVDVVQEWPLRFAATAGKVGAAVHLRLAEHERIWDNSEEAVTRMREALGRSARVDAAILPDGGHLYELHKRGGELTESQLDFFERCLQAAPDRVSEAS